MCIRDSQKTVRTHAQGPVAHALGALGVPPRALAGLEDVDEEIIAGAVPFLKGSKCHCYLVSHEPIG